MTFGYRRAAATAALALAACLGLAACNDGSGSAASASAAATAARSASGSATSSASPTPTDSQAVTASVSPTAVASTSPAPTAKTIADAASRPTATPSAAAAVPAACKNLAVHADVKSAVTRTWEHAKGVSHIQPKPGNFYYGSCGTTLYAAVRFEAGAGATGDDRVQLQDEGSGLQFFRFTPSTGWWFVGSDAYPATGGCSRFAPVALARQWNCS